MSNIETTRGWWLAPQTHWAQVRESVLSTGVPSGELIEVMHSCCDGGYSGGRPDDGLWFYLAPGALGSPAL